MKIRSILFIIMILLLPVFCQAQYTDNKILMTVGESKIQSGEFIRMYKKSLELEKNWILMTTFSNILSLNSR